MSFIENETLNTKIRFPISYLYQGKTFTTQPYSIYHTNFQFIISYHVNQLKVMINRSSSELSCYSIQVSNSQSTPIFQKFSIRFNKGEKENLIYLKDANDYVIDKVYEINLQMRPQKFNVPTYKSSSTSKQPKIDNYYSQTTEDHVGLPNQGATCYLNSLLQVLFHLKKFRKIIYDEKVENDESNFIFCLQLLFRDLQLHKYRRTTRHITNSLGWDKAAVYVSQDVSEFYKFFFESIFKGKSTSLFEGEYDIIIKDLNLKVLNVIQEKFIQVLLNVEGFSNIADSFQSVMHPATFFDNQDVHGTKEKIRQKTFSKLPSIFSIVLKRFWFNDKTKQYEKLNSILVFPEILDLNECGIHCSDSNYQLFAIIAHIGTMNSGHYVSFINPDLRGVWYEFDDNKVYKIEKEKVFDLCYGKNRMNAYMLFYVKMSLKNELFNNSLLQIPNEIQKYKYAITKEPPTQFFMNDEIGIMNNLRKFKPSFLNLEARKNISFEFGTTFSEVYNTVAKIFNKDPNLIRIWNVHNDSLMNVLDKKQKLKKTDNRCWFIQNISESELLMIDENHFIAFIILFIPDTQQKLFYLGSHQFCYFNIIMSIEKVVSQKYFSKPFQFISFAFLKDKIIPLAELKTSSFVQLRLVFNGLFLIIQAQPNDKISLKDLKVNLIDQNDIQKFDENEFNDIIEYDDSKDASFDFADSYVNYKLNEIVFYIYHFSKPDRPFLKISVQKGCSLSHLKSLIAFNAGFDYNDNDDTILLFDQKDSIKYLDNQMMDIILQSGNKQSNLYFIIYKGIKYLNESNQITIEIHYDQKQFKFIIDKNEPKKMIQSHLIDNGFIPNSKNLRFYLVQQSQIISILGDYDIIIRNENYILYIDEIPKYQMEDDVFISKVAQCIKDGDKLLFFGDPFFIGIKFDESCLHVKQKICSVIGCQIQNLNILINNNLDISESYRLLLDNENVLDSLDGNNDLFAFFCS